MPLQGTALELAVVLGGPAVDADDVTVTIRHAGDVVVTDEPERVDTGVYRFVWDIPADAAKGSYLVEWSGVLPDAAAPTLVYDAFTVSAEGDGDWVSLDDLADSLSNAGGAGSRTASELPRDRLLRHLENAHSRVRGRLHRFTIPSPLDDAPGLLRSIVTDIAAYGATLEWNGSQPLEDRDPIALRYAAAMADLKLLANGDTVIAGVDVTSGQPVGDPESYTMIPDVNLATGWAEDTASTTPGYWHGMSQGF